MKTYQRIRTIAAARLSEQQPGTYPFDGATDGLAKKVEIRATHQYGFRSGEWAKVVGVDYARNRPCYYVLFPDGQTDHWPVYDLSDKYEFRPAV
jgi:hypothetical protein